MTGTWTDAAATVAAEALRDSYRPFRVTRKLPESAAITSFYLEPADGGGLPSFEAGQYLPIRLSVPGRGTPLTRTYTVSAAPSDAILRISVKREAGAGPDHPAGLASTFLHDHVEPGDIIEAMAPRGRFVIDAAETRPAVLLSAGVGITPMIAMLRHIVAEGARTRHTRPVWLFHGSRNGRDRAFAEELAELAATSDRVRVHTVFSQPDTEDTLGRDDQSQGHVRVDLLKRILPFDDYDFYLCGPGGFMQDLYDQLRAVTVQDRRIHAEAFGPASLTRQPDIGCRPAGCAGPIGAQRERTIEFRNSGITAIWRPGAGSLLDVAEAAGLSPDSSCRSGICQTCATRLLEGSVAYVQDPDTPPPAGAVLTCSAIPSETTERVVLAL